MTAADQLRAAKALIDSPEKWIKGRFAVDKLGLTTSYDDPRATCFCAVGACRRYCFRGDLDEALPESFVALGKKASPVVEFNDHPDTTHADVMALFDRAIALAEMDHG